MKVNPNLPPDRYKPAGFLGFWGLPVAFLAGALAAYLLLPAAPVPEPPHPGAECLAEKEPWEQIKCLTEAGILSMDDFNALMGTRSLNCCTNPDACIPGSTCGPCYKCNAPPVVGPPIEEVKP